MVSRTPLLLLQDMRVQAFKCSSTKIGSSAPALSQNSPPAHQTEPHPQLTKVSNGSSSSEWVSRTAALIPQRPASNPDPASNASSLPSNVFSSQNAAQNGTNRQDAVAQMQSAKVAGPPEGGALLGSTAMADSHCGVVVALALCGEHVCSAGGDAMIKVWKADTLEFVRCGAGGSSDASLVDGTVLHVETAVCRHSTYWTMNVFAMHCVAPTRLARALLCDKNTATTHKVSHAFSLTCKHVVNDRLFQDLVALVCSLRAAAACI